MINSSPGCNEDIHLQVRKRPSQCIAIIAQDSHLPLIVISIWHFRFGVSHSLDGESAVETIGGILLLTETRI